MLAPSTLHDLASGQRRGFAAALFRGVTGVLEMPVRWYVQRKNRAFDEGRRVAHRVAAPVISVGNLTVGGTGKTPMVEWIARWLQQHDKQVVFISRGYGSEQGHANDEARELALKLPDVPHLQNGDRIAAAQQALAEHPGSVLLLDDAFQHRRIARDLDIVLLDALAPFGFEHVLPRGLLREPVEGLRRAQVVVLSRANLVGEEEREAIRVRVARLAPAAAWVEAVHAPTKLLSHSGIEESLSHLEGKRVAAFCGIGNPAGFRRTLEQSGAAVVGWKEFPDHCAYDKSQLAAISALAAECRAEIIVCTHKDLVKIPHEVLNNLSLHALVIGLQITQGEAALAAALQTAIGS
jgi:tetraacyldisaccharide 4'-kinase